MKGLICLTFAEIMSTPAKVNFIGRDTNFALGGEDLRDTKNLPVPKQKMSMSANIEEKF